MWLYRPGSNILRLDYKDGFVLRNKNIFAQRFGRFFLLNQKKTLNYRLLAVGDPDLTTILFGKDGQNLKGKMLSGIVSFIKRGGGNITSFFRGRGELQMITLGWYTMVIVIRALQAAKIIDNIDNPPPEKKIKDINLHKSVAKQMNIMLVLLIFTK